MIGKGFSSEKLVCISNSLDYEKQCIFRENMVSASGYDIITICLGCKYFPKNKVLAKN